MFDRHSRDLSYDEALDCAMRILSLRAHSEKELLQKLTAKGVARSVAMDVIDYCREHKYLNDADFAVMYAKSLSESKKMGRSRIQRELYEKGIAGEYVDAALESLDKDESQTLYGLMKNRLGGNYEKKNIDRNIRYFANRGYSLTDIFKCIKQIKDEAAEDSD